MHNFKIYLVLKCLMFYIKMDLFLCNQNDWISISGNIIFPHGLKRQVDIHPEYLGNLEDMGSGWKLLVFVEKLIKRKKIMGGGGMVTCAVGVQYYTVLRIIYFPTFSITFFHSKHVTFPHISSLPYIIYLLFHLSK